MLLRLLLLRTLEVEKKKKLLAFKGQTYFCVLLDNVFGGWTQKKVEVKYSSRCPEGNGRCWLELDLCNLTFTAVRARSPFRAKRKRILNMQEIYSS